MTFSTQVRERTAVWMKLIRAAAIDFGFPEPPSVVTNTAEAEGYLARLIAHVESRDLARGFELRVGVKQADWTPDQVKAFRDSLDSRPRRDIERDLKPLSAFRVERLRLDRAIDDACLRAFVDAHLALLVGRRQANGAEELPIIACGILSTGWLLCAEVARADRIGFVTTMARTEPLYGWIVAADMFIHVADVGEGKASKEDVIGVHYGTRTSRGFRSRRYAVVNGRGVFEPERQELFGEDGARVEDPYAFVFMPPTKGKAS